MIKVILNFGLKREQRENVAEIRAKQENRAICGAPTNSFFANQLINWHKHLNVPLVYNSCTAATFCTMLVN